MASRSGYKRRWIAAAHSVATSAVTSEATQHLFESDSENFPEHSDVDSSYIQTVGGLRDLYPPTLRDLYPFTGPLGSLTLGSFHLVTLRDLYPFTGPLGSLTLGSFHLVTLRDLYPFTGPLGSLTLGSFHLVSGKDLKWRRGGGGRAVVGETTRPSSLPSKMTKQKYIVEKSDHKKGDHKIYCCTYNSKYC